MKYIANIVLAAVVRGTPPVYNRAATTLTSPYASCRYRGQYRERSGQDLGRRRHGLGVVRVPVAAAGRAGPDLLRFKPVLGRHQAAVLIQELQDNTVCPAEAQLYLVLASATVSSGHRGVVLNAYRADKQNRQIPETIPRDRTDIRPKPIGS